MEHTINNTRILNQKKIVKLLLNRQEFISQIELQTILNLNLSTIKRICDNLIENKILIEKTIVSNSIGRSRKYYNINPNFGEIIVLLIDRDHFSISITDAQLNILKTQQFDYDIKLNFQEKLLIISKVIDMFKNEKTIHISVVTSGQIANDNYSIIESRRLECNNIDLNKFFWEHNKLNCYVENDINVFSTFESNLGAEQDTMNFVTIAIGSGLGAGVIINNNLYKGAFGGAGEIGHQFYEQTKEVCYCNRTGCFELFLTNRELWQSDTDKYLSILSHLIRNLKLTFDCEKILITGEYSEAIFNHNHILDLKLKEDYVNVELQQSSFEQIKFIKGGALLALYQVFEIMN